MSHSILLPSKPKIVSEDGFSGVYEIDGLYPGYGHTLGNSLRRIILSSLPGVAITSIKIDGVQHEFSTMAGVKEDVITVLLNLKRIRFAMTGDEPQVVTIDVKGERTVTAKDIEVGGQVEVTTKDQYICELTQKSAVFSVEMTLEKGLGYVSKENHRKEKTPIGTIALDASFTPIRRVSYEVENMRVGDRTDHNRLRITIETDGTITPRKALESSIEAMIMQLQAVVGFRESLTSQANPEKSEVVAEETDLTKVKIEDLDISKRSQNALIEGGIKSVAGLARKSEQDLLEIDGIAEKGVEEIKLALTKLGVSLKD
jgi:DNA-directed RNA polymerase subunit alpha